MSVLIKGMEMPDRCFACPMCDTDCCGVSKGPYIEYREVDVDIAIDHRPDWCPLVPVPNHGDLIDRDELEKDIENYVGGEESRSRFHHWVQVQNAVISRDKETEV